MPISEEQVREAEDKYGRVAHVKGSGGTWEILLRKPTRPEYRMFRSKSKNPNTEADAQEDLVRLLSLAPPRGPELDALLDEWPAIPEACSKALLHLMGLQVEQDTGL